MENDIRSKSSSREIDHLYTNIIACAIAEKKSKLRHSDFKGDGWLFGKHRYSTARKRLREETYVNLRPAKRGRKKIPEQLQKKIRDFWIENSRPAAGKDVTNPKDSSDKRPMLRLRFPALLFTLRCHFVTSRNYSNGECSISTF